jgi:TRAP-type C4-dicarboxylate transport system substrate-binding protein
MLMILSKILSSARAAVALVALTFLFPFSAAVAEPTTWRVQSHWPGASSSYRDSLLRLKDTLETRSDGRLKLQMFEAGSLFSAKETFNAVSRGILDMGTISPAYVQNKITLAGMASGMPFAFRHVWEAVYFHKNMGFEDMLRAEAAQYNVYWSTEKIYPTELVLKRPINSLDDLQGLKIRSSGSLQRFLTDAGATASYIPGGELYSALDAGIVDGAHWGASQGANSMALYEVAKYHVQPALTISGTDVFIVSQRSLDKLPGDLQLMVKQALEEQFWLRTNEYLYQERLSLTDAVKNKGVQINSLPDDVQAHLSQVAVRQWEKEGERSDNTKKALSMLKEFLGDLGYL